MVVVVVGVLQVVAGGAQRQEDDSGGLGGEDGAELVVKVAGRSPGQLACRPGPPAFRLADPPVRVGEPLQLPSGHRRSHLYQVGLGFRGDDPGQRPHLGVGQAAGRELPPDERVIHQAAGDPDVLAGGAGGDLALPRQPRRARRHLPGRPSLPLVEVRHQQQELARRRRQVPGQLADPRLQSLQRLRRVTWRRRCGGCARRGPVAARRWQCQEFVHVFDNRILV